MDNLIGDFTIISGDDPAVFETTFPRAVNLEDGLEMGVKSMAFGPIKNLLYPSVKLSNSSKEWDLHLADRYYESQADILLEIHRQMSTWETAYGSIISKLSERNNELTLELLYGFYLEFHEDFFLNRNFKYKSLEASRKRKREVKYDMTESKRKQPKPRKTITQRIADLETKTKKLINDFKEFSDSQSLKETLVITKNKEEWLNDFNNWKTIKQNLIELLDDEFGEMTINIKSQNEKLESFQKLLDEKDRQLNMLIDNLNDALKVGEMDVTLNVERFTKEVRELKKEIQGVQTLTTTISAMLEEQKNNIDKMESDVSNLKRNVEDKHNELMGLIENLTSKLGHDEEQIFATDTTNHSASAKDKLYVISVTASKEIIRGFHMGFLYGDNIEDSLINEKETRLLATLPFDCHRGYGFYEFINPVYKSIRVLKFDKLFFYILDKNGKAMKFNLYGDGKTGNKQFSTILNLHIRKAIKGTDAGG